jgi:hypothetical protein
MRHLAVFTLIGYLAVLGVAQAETNPAPKGPKDKAISGDFTPDRVKSDQEAFAKKLQESGKGPLPRGRNYYFAWSSMTPAEFEALGRHVVLLFVRVLRVMTDRIQSTCGLALVTQGVAASAR